MEKEISKILVRMPQSLKDAIGSRAKEECRSFNSEVIKRLIDSLKRGGNGVIRLDAVVKEIAITILRPNFVHGESFGTNEKLRRERVFSGKRTFSEVMLDAAKKSKQ